QSEIALGPIQISARQVYRRAHACSASRGIDRGGARVCKEIQKALAVRKLPKARARRPMVQEQAGVEIVIEVHAQSESALFHDVEAELLGDFLILTAARLLSAEAYTDAFGGHARDVG